MLGSQAYDLIGQSEEMLGSVTILHWIAVSVHLSLRNARRQELCLPRCKKACGTDFRIVFILMCMTLLEAPSMSTNDVGIKDYSLFYSNKQLASENLKMLWESQPACVTLTCAIHLGFWSHMITCFYKL